MAPAARNTRSASKRWVRPSASRASTTARSVSWATRVDEQAPVVVDGPFPA